MDSKFLNLNDPSGIFLFKGNIGNIKAMCKICSKLTIQTLERYRSSIFIVNFDVVLVFSLITLIK